MNNNLTIVAKLVGVDGKIELLKKELLKLVEITVKEEGCIQYDLHQDKNDSKVFLFYENWATRELWEQHMKNYHIKEFNLATRRAIVDFQLNEMKKVNLEK